MDIVYCIDDNFIPQAASLTASILKNTETSGAEGSGRFRFHVLSGGITGENREKFTSFAGNLGGEVFFYDLGDLEERLEKLLGAKPETGRFAKTVLGRLFAPEYLPEEVKKYLYLDADMIAKKDLSPLYEVPLSGSVLAAVAEPTIYEELSGKRPYFNSGLLLVDREKWEREDITGKCLTWYREHNGKLDFVDQDILNHVLGGKILPLSQRYNFQTNYVYQDYASLVKRSPWYGELETEEDYEASRRDPVLVHFAGDERPWVAGNRNPYRKEFLEALSETPWKGLKPVTGREAYMCFYHLVNVLSGLIPGFRGTVSRIYYRTRGKGKR